MNEYNEVFTMSWLSKMERKYGKYAITNITLYLIICYAVGYIIQLFNASFFNFLTLNPYAVLHGQIWRLFTWILIPPESLDLFTLIMLYFYYSIGSTLERTWGTFRYNVYLISGMIFTIIGAFLLYGICWAAGVPTSFVTASGTLSLYDLLGTYFTTYYVCMSIILAFAATFPNVQVLVMFVIPLKIKVLGIIYAVMLGLDFFSNVRLMVSLLVSGDSVRWVGALANCIAILFSLLNFLIFFITSRKSFRTPKQKRRQKAYEKQTVKIQRIAKNKCAICGRTGEEYPELDFRFCSKCEGNYQYCSDHLFTHTHVK